VKLLFDENLSHKLVGILAHEFPGCAHVRDIGLRVAEDQQIWNHARTQGFVIVSKFGSTSVTQELRRLSSCSSANAGAYTASRNRKKPPCSSCQSGRRRSSRMLSAPG
jgi:hypothetical protein